MRAHDHESDTDAGLRPRGDRVGPGREDLTYRAAAAGRTEALGAGGLLDLQRTVGNAGVGAVVGSGAAPPRPPR